MVTSYYFLFFSISFLFVSYHTTSWNLSSWKPSLYQAYFKKTEQRTEAFWPTFGTDTCPCG